MFSFNWVHWVRSLVRSKNKTVEKTRRFILRVEELETRLAPASFTWTGANGTFLWSDPRNWAGNVAPSFVGDSLSFGSSATVANRATINDIPQTGKWLSSITFAANSYSIAGKGATNVINLGNLGNGGSISVNNGVTGSTINADLKLNANAGIQETISIGSGATLTLNGKLSGAASFLQVGPGTLFANGDGTAFSGPVLVANNTGSGILQIGNANAFGGKGATNTITLENTTQVQVNIPSGVIYPKLVLQGVGPNGTGALIDVDSTGGSPGAYWAGNLTMQGNTTFGAVNDAKLTISGVITDSGTGATFTKEGLGTITLAPGANPVTRAINKSGANNYHGNTFVNNGILAIQSDFALGNRFSTNGGNTYTTTVGYNATTNKRGSLVLDGDPIGAGTQIDVTNELLVINGPGATAALINSVNGSLYNASGDNTWGTWGDYLLPSGQVNLANGPIFLGSANPAGPNISTSGAGKGGLIQITTTVPHGLANNNIVGIIGNSLVTDGIYQITVDDATHFRLQGTSTASSGVNGTWTPITTAVGNAPIVTIGTAAGTSLTVNSVVDNPNKATITFHKEDTGTLVFTNHNLYDDFTDVMKGILEIRDSQGLGTILATPAGTSSGTTVENGATLQLSVDSLVDSVTLNTTGLMLFEQPFTIIGGGFNSLGALYSHSGINVWTTPITMDNRQADGIGVAAAATPTGFNAGRNYDITANGVIMDDSLTITGDLTFNNVAAAGSQVYKLQKLLPGHLVIPNAQPQFTGDTDIIGGTITIENDQALGLYQPSKSLNSQYQVSVSGSTSLHLLPLSALPQNEVQTVTLNNVNGGAFTLTLDGKVTAPIAWNAPATGAGSVTEALIAAGMGLTASDITVSGGNGGPYTVAFQGPNFGYRYVNALIADSSNLTAPSGTPSVAVEITTGGSAGNFDLRYRFVITGLGSAFSPYTLVDTQGAIINLAGINTLSGNVSVGGNVGVGVEQIFTNPATNNTTTSDINYSANEYSQLTLTGNVTQALVKQSFAGAPAGGDAKQDIGPRRGKGSGAGVNIGATSGTLTLTAASHSQPDDFRVYLGNWVDNNSYTGKGGAPSPSFDPAKVNPFGAQLIYDSTGYMDPTTLPAYAGKPWTSGSIGAQYQAEVKIQYDALAGTATIQSVIDQKDNSSFGKGNTGQHWYLDGGSQSGALNTGVAAADPADANYDAVLANPTFTPLSGQYATYITIVVNQWNDASRYGTVTRWTYTLDVEPDSINGGITKLGSQRLIMQNTGQFLGDVDVQQGVLRAQNDTALGTDPAGGTTNTYVETGAALELAATPPGLNGQTISTGLDVRNEYLFLNGSGYVSPWIGVYNNAPSNPSMGAVPFGDAALVNMTGNDISYDKTYQPTDANLSNTNLGQPMAGDNVWSGPVSLNTFATDFSIDLSAVGGATKALTVVGTTNSLSVTASGVGATQTLRFSGINQSLTQTFTLRYSTGSGNTTLPITFNYNTTTMIDVLQQALDSLATIGLGNSAVSALGPNASGEFSTIDIRKGTRLTINGPIDDKNTATANVNGSDLIITNTAGGPPLWGITGSGGSGESALVLNGTSTYRGTTYIPKDVIVVLENGDALGAAATSEIQTLTLGGSGLSSGATPTKFTLTFNGYTTGEITYTGNAATDQAAIQSALNALASIGGADVGGSVSVVANTTAPPTIDTLFTITFQGNLAGFHQPLIIANVTQTSATATIAMTQDGGGGTVVANGASLQLAGNLHVAGEPVILNGSGVAASSNIPYRWIPIGPAPILNSTDVSPTSNVSGRITSVAVDPSDTTGNTYYVTTADGGAWKTVNGGTTWTPLFDFIDATTQIYAGSIAVDPNNPNIVYLGTGDASHYSSTFTGIGNSNLVSFAGSGVYRSLNGGQTWSLLTNPSTNTNPLAGSAVSRVIVDQSSASAAIQTKSVFAFTQQNSATPVTVTVLSSAGFAGQQVFIPGGGVYAVTGILSPTSLSLTNLGVAGNAAIGTTIGGGATITTMSTRIYVASGDTALNSTVGTGNVGVWRYNDSLGWSNLSAGISPTDDATITFPSSNAMWSDIGLTQDGETLYAALGRNTNAGAYGSSPFRDTGVYAFDMSVAGGPGSWTVGAFNGGVGLGAGGNIKIAVVQDANGNGNQAVVFATIADQNGDLLNDQVYWTNKAGQGGWTAMSDNSNGNYMNGRGLGMSAIAAGGTRAQPDVWVASDNDEVWFSANDGTFDTVPAGGNHPTTGIHALASSTVAGNTNLIVGTNSGMWKFDAVATTWSAINNNLAVSQFESISSAAGNSNNVLGGLQDNDTAQYGGDPGWQYAGIDTGNSNVHSSGNQVVFNPLNPNIAYQLVGSTIYQSLNAGDPSTTATWSATLITNAANKFYLDPVNPDRILVIDRTSRNAQQWTYDSGAGTWNFIDFGNTPNPAVPLELAVGAVYQGKFQADPDFPSVTDQGANAYTGGVAPVPAGQQGVIYVTNVQTDLYVTKNGGTTWSPARAIPVGGVEQLLVDPTNMDVLYLVSHANGTQSIWQSLDAGRNWTNISYNLPATSSWALVIDPREGKLYLGTDYGVWQTTYNTTTFTVAANAWSPVGFGLPMVQVRSLSLDPATHSLLAGTYGRSAFRLLLNRTQASAGALSAVAGSSIWGGPIILAGSDSTQANGVVISALGSQSLQNGVNPASLDISGTISDLTANVSGPNTGIYLTKQGGGNVVLSGSNVYNGITEIKEGAILVNNQNALGGFNANTSHTIVNAGTALELESNLYNEPITLYGNGIAFDSHNTGALRNIAHDNTLTGDITLASDATIGVDPGTTLTIGANGLITAVTGGSGSLVEITSSGLTDGQLITIAGLPGVNGSWIVSHDPADSTNTMFFLLGSSGNTPTFAAGANWYAGTVSGAFNLSKELKGTLALANANTYGPTTPGTFTSDFYLDPLPPNNPIPVATGTLVAQGVLNLQNSAAPGLATNTTTVLDGTQLQIQQSPSLNFPVNIQGNLRLTGAGVPQSGIYQSGALYNVNGNNSWTGPITLAKDAGFQPTTTPPNAVTIAVNDLNSPSNPLGTLTLIGDNATPLSDGGLNLGLNKIGFGTLAINDHVDYTGVTNVEEGVLSVLQSNDFVGQIIVWDNVMNSTGTPGSDATFALDGNPTHVDSPTGITVTGDLQLYGTGFNGVGALNNLSGINTWDNTVLGSRIWLNQDASNMTVAIGAVLGTELDILAPIEDPTPVPSTPTTLSKVGLGVVSFPNANSYTGTTTVNAGILNIRNDSSLGGGASGQVRVNSGGTLQLQGGVNVSTRSLTLNGDGATNVANGQTNIGALDSFSGANTWSGSITLASNSSIGADIDPNAATPTLVITQAIGQSGVSAKKLTKVGVGTVQFTGAANTYQGLTDVNAGTLQLNKASGVLSVPRDLQVGDATLVSEVQALDLSTFSYGDSFTLTFNSVTSPSQLYYTEPQYEALQLQAALNALSSVSGLSSFNFNPLTDGGSGYSATPQVLISTTSGPGSGATATATTDGQGHITSISLVSPGSGYTSASVIQVTFVDATGTGAAATANIIGGVLTVWPNGAGQFRIKFGGSFAGVDSNPTITADNGTNQPASVQHSAGGLPALDSAAVLLKANSQINQSSKITINADGLLDLGGFAQTVGNAGSLSMFGGDIQLSGASNLTLGAAGGTTSVSATSVDAGSALIRGPGNVTLAGNAAQTFNITKGAKNSDLIVSSVIQDSGLGLTKTGTGRLELDANNTYTGRTLITNGDVQADGISAIQTITLVNATAGATQIALSYADANIALTTSAPFTYSSSIAANILSFQNRIGGLLGVTPATVNVTNPSSDNLTFVINLTGLLAKPAPLMPTITSYNPLFDPAQAYLKLSSNTINAVEMNGGSLSGNGAVGSITGSPMTNPVSGQVNPGANTVANSPPLAHGILTVNGDVAFGSNTTYFVDLDNASNNHPNPIAGADYDQLMVNGTVTIGNALLTGLPTGNLWAIPTQDQFTILQTTMAKAEWTGLADGVVPTDAFAGIIGGGPAQAIAQGGSVFLNGQKFSLHYYANSVVLTREQAVVALTMTISQGSNPSPYGQEVSYTVTATPEPGSSFITAAPTIKFTLDDPNYSKSVTMTVDSFGIGTATFTPQNDFSIIWGPTDPASATPKHIIAASFTDGNQVFKDAVPPESPITQQVDPNTVGVGLAPDASSVNPVYGQDVTVVATITATDINPKVAGYDNPTGNVYFTLDGGTIYPDTTPISSPAPIFPYIAPTSPETATITFLGSKLLSPGLHTVTAYYGGDANYADTSAAIKTYSFTIGADKADVHFAVGQATSSNLGQPATFSAYVSPRLGTSTGQPKGTLSFYDGAPSTSNPAFYTTAYTGGTIVTPAKSNLLTVPKPHQIYAVFTPDNSGTYTVDAASTAVLNFTVNPAPTTTTITNIQGSPVSTSTPTFGQQLTVTMQVAATPSISGVFPGMKPTQKILLFIDNPSGAKGSPTPDSGYLGEGSVDATGKAVVTTSAFNALLTVGSHTLYAFYQGDTNFAASNQSGSVEGSQSVTISPADVNVALTGTPTSTSPYKGAISFQANVTAPVGNLPTGASATVTFKDLTSGATLGTVNPLAGNGIANISSPAGTGFLLSGGQHLIEARYTTTNTNYGVGVKTLTYTITGAPTSIANSSVFASLNSDGTGVQNSGTLVYGQPFYLNATVTTPQTPGSSTPTIVNVGTVTFKEGSTVLGTGSVDSTGHASILISAANNNLLSAIAAGHTITASYIHAASNYFADSTTPGTLSSYVINPAHTIASLLTSSKSPSGKGEAVKFTAHIDVDNAGFSYSPASAAIVSGTATFTDTFPIGGSTTTLSTTAPVVNGIATYTTTASQMLGIGDHTITVSFNPSSNVNFNTSTTSDSITQSVWNATTTVATASPNPAMYGAEIDVTVVVTGTNIGATFGSGNSSVTVYEPSIPANTWTLSTPTSSTANSLTFKVRISTASSPLALGSHTLQAKFNGDATALYAPSNTLLTNPPLKVQVNASTTSVALTANAIAGFVVGANNAGTVKYGGQVSYTAVVTANSNPNFLVQVGKVDLIEVDANNVQIGQPISSIQLPNTGNPTDNTVTFTTTQKLTASTNAHRIVARYTDNVDTFLKTGTSTPFAPLTVTKNTTAVSLASNNDPSHFGNKVKFTATITPDTTDSAAPGNPPSGTLIIYDTFNSVKTQLALFNLNAQTAAAGNVFEFTTNFTQLAAGTHKITVNYSGNVNFKPFTTPVGQELVQDVTRAVTKVTVGSSTNGTSTYGQSVAFTATVGIDTVLNNDGNGSQAGTPTGFVNFYLDGSATPLNPTKIALVNGVAKYTLTAAQLKALDTVAGGHLITAKYEFPTANFASSAGTITQNVNQAPTKTTFTSTSPTGMWAVNQQTSFKAVVKSSTGVIPVGYVTFTVTGPASPPPTQVNLDSTGTAIFNYTFATSGGPYVVNATYTPVAGPSPSTETNFTTDPSNPSGMNLSQNQVLFPTTGVLGLTFSSSGTMLTATITSPNGTPTGTVNFYTVVNGVKSPLKLNVQLVGGKASTSFGSLNGTVSIYAEYSGDANFNKAVMTGTFNTSGRLV